MFFSPIDFIGETGRRSAIVACFIALAHTVFSEVYLGIIPMEAQNEQRFQWSAGESFHSKLRLVLHELGVTHHHFILKE